MTVYIGDIGRQLLRAKDQLKLAMYNLDDIVSFYGHYYQALEIVEDLQSRLERETKQGVGSP